MKAGWEVVPLGEVASVNYGTRVVRKRDQGSLYPVYGGGGATFRVDASNRSDCTIVSRFGMSVDCVRRVDGPFFLNDSGLSVSSVDGQRLSQEFLDAFLVASSPDIYALGRGTAQKNLDCDAFRLLPIPLPPLDEQKRIVAILDEAFEGLDRARANAEANLADARELFAECHRVALSSCAGAGARVRLDAVADITSSLVDPKRDEYADLPHVGAGNMETGTDTLTNVQTAREEGLKSGKYLFDRSMVLYSKIRPYLRKASRPNFDGLCSADVYPLAPKAGTLDRSYLFYLLLGPGFTEYAISGSARAGMPKVNREHLFAYEFVLPSIEEQTRIADELDAMMQSSTELEFAYRCKLADLAALRQSLLQKAFSGELT